MVYNSDMDFLVPYYSAHQITKGKALYDQDFEIAPDGKEYDIPHYPPLFTYTLAAILLLLGSSFWVAKLFLWTCQIISTELLRRSSKELGLSDKKSLWIAIIWLIYPFTWVIAIAGLNEPFMYIFIWGGIWLITKNQVFWAGVVLGIGGMTKGIPLLIGVAFFIVFFGHERWKEAFKLALGQSISFGGLFGLFYIMWGNSFYNASFKEQMIRQSDSMSLIFYLGNKHEDHFMMYLILPLSLIAVLTSSLYYIIKKGKINTIHETSNNGEKMPEEKKLLIQGLLMSSLLLLIYPLASRVVFPHYYSWHFSILLLVIMNKTTCKKIKQIISLELAIFLGASLWFIFQYERSFFDYLGAFCSFFATLGIVWINFRLLESSCSKADSKQSN